MEIFEVMAPEGQNEKEMRDRILRLLIVHITGE